MSTASPRDIILNAVRRSVMVGESYEMAARWACEDLTAAGYRVVREGDAGTFRIGDRVTKISGSSWTGRVVGTYSTSLTPEGYAVESENEPGSVQIYPAAALRALAEAKP